MLPWFTNEVEYLIMLSVLSCINGHVYFPLDYLIDCNRFLYIKDDNFLMPYFADLCF